MLSLAVLAFVTPHDLGVYSLAFSFVLILALVIDDPISEALIQAPQPGRVDWDTGFTANLAAAAGIVALSWAASGPVSRLFGEPDLATALPVLASSILIGSVGNIQKAHLTRELQFPALVRIALLANAAGGMVALCLAALGWGYWALLSSLIMSNLVSSALYWRASTWVPRLALSRASASGLLAFAGPSFLAQCVLQLREGALPIAIGWFGGATLVGSFALALRVARTLGLFFEDLTRRPLFTLASRLHRAQAPVAPLLANVVALVAAVALPAFAGLALAGPVVTPLVFGARWAEGGALLPLLCAIVLGWLALSVPAIALRATGQPGRAVRVLALPTGIDLAIIAAFMPAGVGLALWAMAVRAALWTLALPALLQRLCGVPARMVLAGCRLPVLGVCGMVPAVLLVRAHAGTGWGGALALVAAGVLVYGAVLDIGYAEGISAGTHTLTTNYGPLTGGGSPSSCYRPAKYLIKIEELP